jgi:hypothetical protein
MANNTTSTTTQSGFKLYTDKSSLDRKYSRMVLGGTVDQLDNGTVLGWWEKKEFPRDQVDDVKFIITLPYEKRPDKISYYMYGREDLAWLVLQYNNIVDINEELISGVTLTLPSYQRTLYSLANE